GDLFQFMEATSAEHKLRTRNATDATPVDAAAPPVQTLTQDSVWDIVVRWYEDAWEFVVKIGEAIYRCVLDAAEAIIGAVRWVYDKIVTAVEDLIRFLQFLFEWDDFTRTKDVIKNLTTVFLQHEIDQIPVVKQQFDTAMDQLVATIDAWGGVPNLDGLGTTGTGQLASQSSTNGPDAPGSMLSHHFQGNVGSATHTAQPPQPPPASVFDALEQALEHEKGTLGEAYEQLQILVQQAPTLSLVALLRRLTAILGHTVLRSAQVVLDALLDILHILASKLLEFLDTPIHIPVISDILNAIGIPDFSMLDIVCWVAAVPVTIGYKIGTALAGQGQAPFPDTAETRLLIQAKDFATIAAAFAQPTTPNHPNPPEPERVALARTDTRAGDGPTPMSPIAQEAVFISLHSAAGVCAWVSAFLDSFESILPTKAVPTLLSAGSAAVAFLGGVSRGIANVLMPRYPLTNNDANQLSAIFLFTFGVNKVFAALAGKFQQPGDLRDYRARGAAADAVLVIPSTVITILHFVELGGKPDDKQRTVAIMDESSSVVTYITRLLYTTIVGGLIQDPAAKLGLATIMGITSVIHGGIQFSVAAVEGLG
ncbi:MAG TPA: hypothetical protein VFP34_09280, partial [Microlunatus sp.]|nr:hypothetical protein [Microlunatus sp.]